MNEDNAANLDVTAPSLHGEVTFIEKRVGGQPTYICNFAPTGKLFHFGTAEHAVALLLQRPQTVGELLAQVQQLHIGWKLEDLTRFLDTLTQHGLAIPGASHGAGQAVPGQAPAGGNAQGASPPTNGRLLTNIMRSLSALLSQRLPLFEADRFARRAERTLGWLFRPRGVVAVCCLWSVAIGVALAHHVEMSSGLKHLFSLHAWPVLAAAWFAAKLAHESGHAIAAKRLGVRVGQAGIQFFLFTPLLFVNVTPAWKLTGRWQRVQIALAGVYVELIISAAAILLWWWLRDPMLQHYALQVALVTGPATLLVNANPLLRLDGYYAFSDAVNIPNLRMHGRRQLKGLIEHSLLGRPIPPSLLSGWRVRVATIHAACSVAFQVIWISGLVLGVAYWAAGLGILLAIAAILMWAVIPFSRWLFGLYRAEDWSHFRWRITGAATIGVALIIGIGTIPSPLCHRIPVVARYQDAQVVRAAANGFVRACHVRHGQQVESGDALITIENTDLKLEHDKLATEIEATKLRIRRLQQSGELSEAAAQVERLTAQRKQLIERRRQLDELEVRANQSGTIVAADLSNLVGQFVQQGQELAVIGTESQKEILASIANEHLEAYNAAAATNQLTAIRFRGGQHLQLKVVALQPRVSREIPHPALAANAGGPLAVTQASESPENPAAEMQLVESRSLSISPLDAPTSQRVRSGQQGVLLLGDTRSLWTRLREWIEDQVETAST